MFANLDSENSVIFNLQLTIQKLQEEVTLYRNGTDVPQLLELIKEKDIEIDSLKESSLKSEEKIYSLTQSRANIITKQEDLLVDLQQVKSEKAISNYKLSKAEEQLQRNETEYKLLEQSFREAENMNQVKEETVKKLEEDIRNLNNIVYELQNKNAKYIKEKNEVLKLLEKEKVERSKQVNEYRVSFLVYSHLSSANLMLI